MSDTMGSLIDKLITIDMKMWNNQEFLYEVRRISFDEFKENFVSTEKQKLDLFNSIKKCCDLNFQRNQIIDEIDERVTEIIEAKNSENIKFQQKKHKTY